MATIISAVVKMSNIQKMNSYLLRLNILKSMMWENRLTPHITVGWIVDHELVVRHVTQQAICNSQGQTRVSVQSERNWSKSHFRQQVDTKHARFTHHLRFQAQIEVTAFKAWPNTSYLKQNKVWLQLRCFDNTASHELRPRTHYSCKTMKA